MPRLGEILVQHELISDAQLHEGLQTQVLYGGRLGTNLVELGYLTLDQLAKALARRHRLPAALGAHFDRCDPALQARVPVEIASKWRAVPIGRLAQDQRRLAVAVRDPLPEHGRGELAFQLDVDPEELVQAIAPELRIHYHLEIAYQLPRSNRFLRVKARVPIGLPVPPENVEDTNLEGWVFKPGGRAGTAPTGDERGGRPPAGTLVRATERVPMLDPPTRPSLRPAPPPPAGSAAARDGDGEDATIPIETAVAAPVVNVSTDRLSTVDESVDVDLRDTADRERAAAVASAAVASAAVDDDDLTGDLAGDVDDDDVPINTDSDPLLRLDSQVGLKPRAADGSELPDGVERRHFVPTLSDTSTQSTLARIAVRQIAHDSGIRPIADLLPVRPQGPEELARAVRRAETRDRVGELIIEALGELPGAPLDAAAIFVVRPPLAIGWKGFCDDGNAVIESLAVPLDQPGLLADAYHSQRCNVCTPTAATVIDERMWSLLGGPPPTHVVVAPIVVGDHCVCILYAHSSHGLGVAEALCITLSDAAATAFGRLLRAAQR